MSVLYVSGDVRAVMADMPDGSVDLIMTSPPFLALRSYLPDDDPMKPYELGQEPDPAAFVQMLLELTAEWRRLLTPTGSLVVELGDTYSDGADDWPMAKSLALIPESYRWALVYGRNPFTGNPSPAGEWRARNVVRWVRPNPPVGALGDKFRPATSELVIACVAGDRWFDLDAVRTEPVNDRSQKTNGKKNAADDRGDGKGAFGAHFNERTVHPAGAPPLDWWEIVPGGYSGSHYAVYPPELCVRPIEAMCPRRVCRTCGKPSRRETERTEEYRAHRLRSSEAGTDMRAERVVLGHGHSGRGSERMDAQNVTTGWSTCGCPGTDGIRLDGFHTGTGWRPGIVLDPFGGSGTTGMVAHGHSRDAILIDFDRRNVEQARDRIGPLWLTTSVHPSMIDTEEPVTTTD